VVFDTTGLLAAEEAMLIEREVPFLVFGSTQSTICRLVIHYLVNSDVSSSRKSTRVFRRFREKVVEVKGRNVAGGITRFTLPFSERRELFESIKQADISASM
jgi:hypothetical protein